MFFIVMVGLVPTIHDFFCRPGGFGPAKEVVDARDKREHDD